MRASGLMRDKYEREDYLHRTIQGAVDRQEAVYGDKVPAAAPSALPLSLTVPSGKADEMCPEDYWAVLPNHNYINRKTRAFLSVDAINGSLKRFTDSLGMKPALYLDMFRAVQQMSWHPGYPEIIEGMVSDKGQLIPEVKGKIYNLYRATDAVAVEGDPSPWINHVRLLYGEEADHIIKWFAFRIQNPGEKINHALVIGGPQGIGKDLMLEPLRYGVGKTNVAEANPSDLFKDFTQWVESTLVVINEARDLGDVDRYKFYESSKRFIAAPPDTLPCNRKYLASYDVPNVMAVVITSNNKLNGLHIDPDDRRHFVAWCPNEKQSPEYFNALWPWTMNGGKQIVFGYLQKLALNGWDAKAPPPKTEAWHQIVEANANPDELSLADTLEGNQCVTLREIIAAVQFKNNLELAQMLQDKRNARKIPAILERCGFEALQNPYTNDGRWRLSDGRKDTLYVDRRLPKQERLQLASAKAARV
jgi:hypothetical protein